MLSCSCGSMINSGGPYNIPFKFKFPLISTKLNDASFLDNNILSNDASKVFTIPCAILEISETSTNNSLNNINDTSLSPFPFPFPAPPIFSLSNEISPK